MGSKLVSLFKGNQKMNPRKKSLENKFPPYISVTNFFSTIE